MFCFFFRHSKNEFGFHSASEEEEGLHLVIKSQLQAPDASLGSTETPEPELQVSSGVLMFCMFLGQGEQ